MKCRVIELSLADLNNNEALAFREIKLCIEDVQGYNCLVNFHGVDSAEDDSTGGKITPSQMQELERRRVVRLALKLRERIQSHVDGNKEATEAEWKAEAARVVEWRYGQEILIMVETTYKLVAKQCVGSWSDATQAKMDERGIKFEAAKNTIAGRRRFKSRVAGWWWRSLNIIL